MHKGSTVRVPWGVGSGFPGGSSFAGRGRNGRPGPAHPRAAQDEQGQPGQLGKLGRMQSIPGGAESMGKQASPIPIRSGPVSTGLGLPLACTDGDVLQAPIMSGMTLLRNRSSTS
jgi:hypothetical protein